MCRKSIIKTLCIDIFQPAYSYQLPYLLVFTPTYYHHNRGIFCTIYAKLIIIPFFVWQLADLLIILH